VTAFDTHQAFGRLTAAGMDEAPAEAVIELVDDAVGDLVTKDDLDKALDLAVTRLTGEMHRALRVQGMWIVGVLTGLATIGSVVVGTALVLINLG